MSRCLIMACLWTLPSLEIAHESGPRLNQLPWKEEGGGTESHFPVSVPLTLSSYHELGRFLSLCGEGSPHAQQKVGHLFSTLPNRWFKCAACIYEPYQCKISDLLETRIPFMQTTSSSLPRNGSFVIQDPGMLFRELRDVLPDLEGLHLKKRAQDEETEYLLEGLVGCKKNTKNKKPSADLSQKMKKLAAHLCQARNFRSSADVALYTYTYMCSAFFLMWLRRVGKAWRPADKGQVGEKEPEPLTCSSTGTMLLRCVLCITDLLEVSFHRGLLNLKIFKVWGPPVVDMTMAALLMEFLLWTRH